jgi:prephenate dehydratase
LKKIGYLGPQGTFCEQAAQAYTDDYGAARLIPFINIPDLLIAADKKKIDEAVVPIENSVEGTIGVVTDMLARDVSLKIKKEILLPIYHYLLAPAGTTLTSITDIVSHPQAIEQCKDYIRKKLKRAKLHLAYSTADAVRQVATSVSAHIIGDASRKSAKFAAIGNISASHLYGLKIVASKINVADNVTRFVVLGKSDAARTGDDKTSLVFSIAKDRPGGLHYILGEFATRAINLTKIESRPTKKLLGEYLFFIDIQGHNIDPLVKEALSDVQHKASFFKVLGSYHREKLSGEKHEQRK